MCLLMQDALKTPHFVGGLNCAPYISMSATSFGPGHSATSAGFNEDEGAAPMLDVDSDDDYAAAAMEWEAPADSNARKHTRDLLLNYLRAHLFLS